MKLVSKIAEYSVVSVIVVGTLFVLAGSVPTVYLFAYMFNVEYTQFLFIISIALPIILTPATLGIFAKTAKHLSYFKKHLQIEIEENKRKDIVIHEQARFALIGEMMANISHQWKQPLNTIGLSIVNMRVSDKKDLDKAFDTIEDNIAYLSRTIDDFMSYFDKRAAKESKAIDDILREINSISAGHISSKKVELSIELGKDCSSLYLASSISQVLLNLINNSVDAFEKEQENKIIKLMFECNEHGLNILCCDNGSGIDQSIVESIFMPYFTTKEKTQGTGIGLYMSKEIIDKLFDGRMEVSRDTAEKNGMSTCFKIRIPYSQHCTLKDKK